MARNERTPEQFDAIAKELSEASMAVAAISGLIKESGMPHALIHGSTTLNKHLPALMEWINKTMGDVKNQSRAYLTGTQSSAEFQKQQSDKQKLAAAKKPWPKKTAKKKPPA
jgi:hypothetical protein